MAHEHFRSALDGVTARFADAFAAVDVAFDLGLGQAAERHARGNDPCTDFHALCGDRDSRRHEMLAAG